MEALNSPVPLPWSPSEYVTEMSWAPAVVLAASGKLPVTTSPPPRKAVSSAVSTPVPVAADVSKVASVVPSQLRVFTVTPLISVTCFLVMVPVRVIDDGRS